MSEDLWGSGQTPGDPDPHLRPRSRRRRRRRGGGGEGLVSPGSSFGRSSHQRESSANDDDIPRGTGLPSMKPILVNWRTSEPAEHPGLEAENQNQNRKEQQRFRPRTEQIPSKRNQLLMVPGREPDLAGPPSCKRTSSWLMPQKNPVVHLNEVHPGLQYRLVSRTGPVHAPQFSIGVEVRGVLFQGRGPTKRQAKRRAAESALGSSFIQTPAACRSVDFTADRLDSAGALFVGFDSPESEPSGPVSGTPRLTLVDLLPSQRNRRVRENLRLRPTASEPPGPVDLLHRLHPGLRTGFRGFQVERNRGVGSGGARVFLMVLWVEGRVFEGRGRSKRLARTRAAAAALQALHGITVETERNLLGVTSCNAGDAQIPQMFSQALFHLVREKYEELTHSWDTSSHTRHKNLAGVVMTRGFSLSGAQVVALGSGTRCRGAGGACREQGQALTDCHAEVMARRALVGFLYFQLELLVSQQAEGLEHLEEGLEHLEEGLERLEEGLEEGLERSVFRASAGGVFRLKEGLLFHMVLSSSPCGDARLHCPYRRPASPLSSAQPARNFRSHLRSKTEGGEGTLPVRLKEGANQDGGIESRGSAVITMSCTDKIARWSVLGLQGALLSRLVEPVYLYSLSVGGLAHPGHLARTLGRRTAHLGPLPGPYRRTLPRLGCVAGSQTRQAGGSPDLSLSWSLGAGDPEEVSASSGRRSGGGGSGGRPSRLCRRSLFARWQCLQLQLKGGVCSEDPSSSLTYSGAKMAAGRYQRARWRFVSALQVGGLGRWPGKPQELGGFSLTT